jgi:hypothetical protein
MGTEVDLCLDFSDPQTLCGASSSEAFVFPTNFSGEAFRWSGESFRTTNNGAAEVLLIMAVEASIRNGEVATARDQVAFNRTRI